MKPLENIRVLDFTHVLAGPVCSRLLGDLGAEVLKVETRKRPDRPWAVGSATVFGRSQSFVMVHRGKKSITLDLKNVEGVETVRRLAAAADVVVENFSAGVMVRLGLGYEALARDNPGLVFVSMSGYGNDGPRSSWTSMNSILQSHSGSMMATDREGASPVSISNSWMDYMGGLHACFAVLEGLAARREAGQGRYVDLSQFECGVAMLGPNLLAGIANGVPPQRLGNRSTHAAPQGVYRCSGDDRWCAISVENDEQWSALGRTLGAPAWSQDTRFASVVGRLRHHDELDANITACTRLVSASDVAERLRAAGVPAEAMRTASEVLADADARAVYSTPTFDKQSVLLSHPPFRFLPHQPADPAPPPSLDEHGRSSLRTWLGLDDAAIARLEAAQALV